MKRTIALLSLFSACVCVMPAGASWYWPFGDDDGKSRLRVSELMEPATRLIDAASDLAAEGKVDEAVAEYRMALQELARIELENPERSDTPEFATLRNKRAYIEAAIDSLLLDQAHRNARAVAVTDTTDLERRYKAEVEERKAAKARKPKVAPDRSRTEDEAKPEPEKKPELKVEVVEELAAEEQPQVEEQPAGVEPPPAEGQPAPAPEVAQEEVKDADSDIGRLLVKEDVPPAAEKTPASQPAAPSRKERMQSAKNALHAREFGTAKEILRELLDEKPNDAPALNLKALVEMAEGDDITAEKTLTRLINSNPRAWYGHYNLARLILRTRGEDGKEAARRYYQTGHDYCGGPADAELEAQLK